MSWAVPRTCQAVRPEPSREMSFAVAAATYSLLGRFILSLHPWGGKGSDATEQLSNNKFFHQSKSEEGSDVTRKLQNIMLIGRSLAQKVTYDSIYM